MDSESLSFHLSNTRSSLFNSGPKAIMMANCQGSCSPFSPWAPCRASNSHCFPGSPSRGSPTGNYWRFSSAQLAKKLLPGSQVPKKHLFNQESHAPWWTRRGLCPRKERSMCKLDYSHLEVVPMPAYAPRKKQDWLLLEIQCKPIVMGMYHLVPRTGTTTRTPRHLSRFWASTAALGFFLVSLI